MNSVVENKQSLDNPSFVTSIEEAAIYNPTFEGKDQIGDKWIQTFPRILLDYEKELSEATVGTHTWEKVVIPTRFETDEEYIISQFKIEDGIWHIPVNEAGSNFVVVEVIQRDSLYTIFGAFTYRSDDGMNHFLKSDTFNIKSTTKESQSSFEKYQTFWNDEWTYNYETTDTNEWTMLDRDNPAGEQGINGFSSPIPIPVQITTITNIVESQYEPFSKLIEFFIISMFAMTFLIVLIFTKEIIDSTKKEASVLKDLGYRNYKASSLVIDPQGILMFFSFLISIPLSMLTLSYLSTALSESTGMVFMLSWQGVTSWLILVGILSMFIVIFILGYLSFKRLSPLHAMKD